MRDYSSLKILVLGARERHALVIVRSLAALGCRVFTADCLRLATASLSRHSAGSFLYRDPEKQASGFLDDLEKILRRENFDFIFAVSDLLPILLSQHRDRFRGLGTLAIPEKAIFDGANIKSQTFAIAARAGVEAPKSFLVENEAQVAAALAGLSFPVVLKPVSKTHLRGEKTSDSVKAHYLYHREEALRLMKLYAGTGRHFLLQEYIPGPGGEGVGALCRRGRALALFSYRRLHEYPLSGGASTLRISTDDPDLKRRAAQLLEAMEWEGVAMVEFKRDARTGIPKLIEVNGRYWGSLALAVESGVDFPALHLKLLLGETLPESTSYRAGIQVRWLLPGDLLYTWARFRKIGLRALVDFVKGFGIRDDVWRWNDPLPVLGEIRSSLFYLGQVLRGQRRFNGEYRGQ